MLKSPSRFRFYWRGVNSQGEPTEGYIEANNKNIAAILLSRQGIVTHQLKRLKHEQRKTSKKKMIVSFFKQLAALLKANLPLMHALETLKRTQQPFLRQLIEHIQQHLQKGLPFSQALQQYPQYFTPLMCGLIAIGEQACQFDAIIFKLADHEEKQLQTQRQFYLSLSYPALVALVSLSLMIGLCVFVLPQFLSFYQAFQVKLPKITEFFIDLTQFIKSYGITSIAGSLMTMIGLSMLYQYHQPSKKRFDTALLRLPYFGNYFSILVMARTSGTLSLTLRAGLPLLESLRLLNHMGQNTKYQEAFLKIHQGVREGLSLTQAMRLTHRFSEEFIEMVAIGEESGKLSSMFSEIANHFEEIIKQHSILWGKLLEPLTMIVLGIIMGLFLLALYLPIFQLGVAL